jgi:DNA-binding NarL/FixJ family response regulator
MTLAGRHGELNELDVLLGRCLGGQSSVVAVTGAVGLGKTELLHAFADRAVRRGLRFLIASASRAERSLPLGVMHQLFSHVDLPRELTEQTARLLDEGALGAAVPAGHDERSSALVPHRLGSALLALAAETPLLVAVDDVHHADVQSLRCLSYLARRMRSARVLLLFTEAPRLRTLFPDLYTELLRPPYVRRVRLGPLGGAAVREMLTARMGARAEVLLAACQRMSGGSPLLVQALIEDSLAAGLDEETPRLVAGEAFREAVIGCLYRCESTVLDAARAVAVCGADASPALLSQLLDLQSEWLPQVVNGSTSGGLLEDGRFADPAVAEAVLDGMLPDERAALHGRVAQIAQRDGAPAPVVARHLVEAGERPPEWATPVLQEAAEHALGEGRVDFALRSLRAARRGSGDERMQARISSTFARAEWRVNPASALRHLPDLTAAARAGHLTDRHAVVPIRHLLWHGRVDEAVDLIAHLSRSKSVTDADAAADLVVTKAWMSSVYPALDADVRLSLGPVTRDRVALAKMRTQTHVLSVLRSALESGGSDDVVAGAEQVLLGATVDETAWWPITAALAALTYADRLDAASGACDRLTERATASNHRTLVAFVGAIRAEIALRRGRLAEANRLAGDALRSGQPQSWGVAIGVPLGTKLRAATAMGRLEEAAECLRTPVPKATFDTPFGLHYLHARGQYFLAAGCYETALSDLRTCGELMSKWQLDLPALVPWRTDAARACLRLGRRRQAAELVQDQLTRLRPGHLRCRGASLRVLAALSDLHKRRAVLQEAVRVLQACGDRLELAYALTDLARTYRALGEHRQARATVRSARLAAEQCRAHGLRASLSSDSATATDLDAHDEPDAATPAGPGRLSAAEYRVAVLAARGLTNQEIAGKLFVTVSTVEQHLTHSYRKLHINRRADLRAGLGEEGWERGRSA